jgi:hypothetical protein
MTRTRAGSFLCRSMPPYCMAGLLSCDSQRVFAMWNECYHLTKEASRFIISSGQGTQCRQTRGRSVAGRIGMTLNSGRCENSAEDGSPKMGVSTTSRRLVPREPRPDVRAYDTPGSPSSSFSSRRPAQFLLPQGSVAGAEFSHRTGEAWRATCKPAQL